VKRRQFVSWGCATCALPGALLSNSSVAQDRSQGYTRPNRLARPSLDSDEGGLWAMMEREEVRARRSPFAIKDAELTAYVSGIACKLAGEHCADLRVHLIRTPQFNASMAPNGMMQVWSGLMLRVENEAQLAAVLGHEIGHFYERHSLERLRNAKEKSAAALLMLPFGLVGAIGALGMIGGFYGFSRDQERNADQIGLQLMQQSGYDSKQASVIWKNVLDELKAGGRADQVDRTVLTATHPGVGERIEVLENLAKNSPQGNLGQKEWLEKIAPFRLDWINDEVARAQHAESLALFNRLLKVDRPQPELHFAVGEVYRTRAAPKDFELALASYQQAILLGKEPSDLHRSMGFLYRSINDKAAAEQSLNKYLELNPKAQDAGLVRGYIQEMKG
jgi:beta-barrel assembly-enhancing protease